MRLFPLLTGVIFLIAGWQCADPSRVNYHHPIPFEPATYVCYRAAGPLLIDGRLDEPAWQSAPWTADFVDIEGAQKPVPAQRTRARMLWDDDYFYFAARLDEAHLWATLTRRDTIIYQNDDFEIFIDPDGDGLYYYEFEMNALNTVWDLFMLRTYRTERPPYFLFHWNIDGLQSAVHLSGTLNDPADTDTCWTIEVAIPWEVLQEMTPDLRPPRSGEQWRVNFSRVDWWMDVEGGRYVKRPDPATGLEPNFPQENWVWSPTGYVDMHRPEAWGRVQFSDIPSGSGEEAFVPSPDEPIRWALWQLFYQQQQIKEQTGRYTADLRRLTLPEVPPEDYRFEPRIAVTQSQFELTAATADGRGWWHLNDEGRIWRD